VNPKLDILGVLITRHDGRKNVCKAMKAAIERRFESKVFQTAITSSAKIQEAEANKRTIFQHDRQSNGARDFMKLGREVLARLQLQPTVSYGFLLAVIQTVLCSSLPITRRSMGMRKAMPTIVESADDLQRRMKSEPDSKKRQRLHALYLAASGQARHRQAIAALLGVHRHSVAAWFAAYAEGG
jgi:Homeodomain-like domain